jgi:hypothetical protein
MKTLFTLALITLLNTALSAAPGFQGSFRNVGPNITFYIRPEATISTGIAVIDFFVRYPNTQTLSFSEPIGNKDYLPLGSSILVEVGVEGAYNWIHFSYTAPNPIISSRAYPSGVEMAVFTTKVSGSSSPANLQLVHREAEDPFVFGVLSGVGGDLRPTDAAGALDNAKVFYPNTSADGLTQKLALDVVLPLNLLDFTARATNQSAVLNWKTAEERNASHFEIERSLDLKNWEKIGIQKALNTQNTEGYSFTHTKAFEKSNTPFYRLKMMDNDGSFTYSPIRQVRLEKATGLKVYPNPAKSFLQVAGIEATESWQVVDVLGKVHDTFAGPKELNLASYTEGVYFIKSASGKTAQFIVSQ